MGGGSNPAAAQQPAAPIDLLNMGGPATATPAQPQPQPAANNVMDLLGGVSA